MYNTMRTKPWSNWLVLIVCVLFSGAVAADTFVIVGPSKLGIEEIQRGSVVRVFKGVQRELNGKSVAFAIRKERRVSDEFTRIHYKSSWFDYLDDLNLAFYQQRLRSLPPIQSLDEFIALNAHDPRYLIYATVSELKEVSLPPTLRVMWIE
ncbi:hypothetical protein [Limnobacter sp.]|uniref:hypothetical protein n=1 Tax=Limnobacter sp. TaxID=2003368 RepID=UPI003513165B